MTTSAPVPSAPLTAAQQNAINILAKTTPYLSTGSQAIASAFMGIAMGGGPVMELFNALMGVTNAIATVPNPSVATYAGLASVFESLIGATFEGIETATTPAAITPNAKPNVFLKLFHPTIAKEEEALAASEAAAAIPAK
jgi:hypothetical protein